MSTKSLASSVSAFLSSTRAAGLRGLPPLASLTIVLGNPSADLDSFISAVVYAYFCSAPLRKDNPKRWFIPVLNLPTTPACDLWRLRPEFATALKLAEGRPVEHGSRSAVKDENNRVLLGQLITISAQLPRLHRFHYFPICRHILPPDPAKRMTTSLWITMHQPFQHSP
jgi:hypothetical protein